MSVSVVQVSGAEGTSDDGVGVAIGGFPFSFDFGGDFNSLDLGEGEEGGGECVFHWDV